jgi:hypothetical protein
MKYKWVRLQNGREKYVPIKEEKKNETFKFTEKTPYGKTIVRS